MNAGQFDIACPALAESQRLDPRAGTLFALADCQSKAGKIATAVALYEDYLRAYEQLEPGQKLRHAQRQKLAAAQKAALAPEIPELTLVLPKDAPPGTRVWRDETELNGPSLGIGLPLDPGGHSIRVEVPGRETVTRQIVLDRGEKETVVLELPPAKVETSRAAVDAKPALPVKSAAASARKAPGKPVPAPLANPGEESSGRTGVFIAAGFGLAGLVTGGVAGWSALEKKGIADEHCNGGQCDREGKIAGDSGKTAALISTVGFGVGIAGAATAVVLWLTGSPAKQSGESKRQVQAEVLNSDRHGAVIGLKGVF